MSLPSKEGLSIGAQISILYKLDKKMAVSVINNIGLNYETIVSNVFRSSASDVCAQFYAKDMHSGMRSDIENKIKERMGDILNPQGIIIQAVLMKSIQLPPGLAGSIEQRLQAEQDALRMEYILQQTKLEADRKIIEAKGTRDAQIILSEGLNSQILQLKSIDAFLALAKSNNAKIIITDGKTPFMMNDNIISRDTVRLKR